MKTPEDEAFEDIERRQGGFQAKRKAAMDKINADFDEEYIKYRTAFPKEYTAASVLGDQVKYGTSWSKDGERIDPMSVYKEPEQEPVAEVIDGVLVKSDLPEKYTGHLYAMPPQREWVGLTDEDCKGMNAGDKVVAMWANRILKEKNT